MGRRSVNRRPLPRGPDSTRARVPSNAMTSMPVPTLTRRGGVTVADPWNDAAEPHAEAGPGSWSPREDPRFPGEAKRRSLRTRPGKWRPRVPPVSREVPECDRRWRPKGWRPLSRDDRWWHHLGFHSLTAASTQAIRESHSGSRRRADSTRTPRAVQARTNSWRLRLPRMSSTWWTKAVGSEQVVHGVCLRPMFFHPRAAPAPGRARPANTCHELPVLAVIRRGR